MNADVLLGTRQNEPLGDHVVFRTSDLAVAIDHAGAYFAPHRLTLHDRDPQPMARMNACRVGSVLLAYFDYGVHLSLRATELENLTVLLLPLAGWIRVEQGGHEVVASPTCGAVLQPDLGSRLVWSTDLSVLALALDHDALREHLGRLTGTNIAPTLTFEAALRPEQRAGALQGMTNLLLDLAREGRPGGPAPLLAMEASRAAMTTLLVSQPHNHHGAMFLPPPAAAPTAVRAVAELIRADPGGDHQIPALAAEAGISVRSLQAGFRQQFGMSPTTFLRTSRLDRVHEALSAADPARGAVSEIATEWGFAHLGRFAAEYLKRFGQSPSATLRTRR